MSYCLTQEIKKYLLLSLVYFPGEIFKECGKAQVTCTYTCMNAPMTNMFWASALCRHWGHEGKQAADLVPGSWQSNRERALQKPQTRHHDSKNFKVHGLRPTLARRVARAGPSAGWATWCPGEHLSQEDCSKCRTWPWVSRTTYLGCIFNTNKRILLCSLLLNPTLRAGHLSPAKYVATELCAHILEPHDGTHSFTDEHREGALSSLAVANPMMIPCPWTRQ